MTARKTLASAIQIGNPVSIRKAIATMQRFNGVVEQASELELAEEVARADRTGMFNCPHTGVALAALRKLVERKVIHGHERVVVISTAHGLKFADQKIAYHAGTLEGIQGTQQNRPVEVERRAKKNQRCDLALRRAHAAAGQLMEATARAKTPTASRRRRAASAMDRRRRQDARLQHPCRARR